MLDTAKTYAFISVHENVAFHALVSHLTQGYRIWILDTHGRERTRNETCSLIAFAGCESRFSRAARRVSSKCDSPGVSLEMRRDTCQIAGVDAGILTGPRPDEFHHESRSVWPAFLFPPQSDRVIRVAIPWGLLSSAHHALHNT
jgi:hypothetical protein